MYVQNISYAVAGAALIINAKLPQRKSCKNIHVTSGTTVKKLRIRKSKHTCRRLRVMKLHLIGNRAAGKCSGNIRCALHVLSAGIDKKHTFRLNNAVAFRRCAVMHHCRIGSECTYRGK